MSNNNYRILLVAGLLSLTCISFTSVAAPIDIATAKKSAYQFMSTQSKKFRAPASESSLNLSYTSFSGDGDACFYVFSDNNNAGFTIISADTDLPTVLAYSNESSFDSVNMPENLRWWLGEYTKEISAFYMMPVEQRTASSLKVKMNANIHRKSIAPLLTTKWDQSNPYNQQCPIDNGQRSVTGCVATAIAQIMKYHNWPEKGTGSHNGVTFDNTTYRWDQMLDVYSNNQWTVMQADAVSTLMYHCGIAVDMQYSSSVSGAYSYNVQPALATYFDYDKGIKMEFRDYYSLGDWEDILYAELESNRPIYYSGQAAAGGHAFVCDGYSEDGYFHFNWGWSGYQDGYFLIDALNPESGGIGSYEGGFNTDQQIIINIKKNEGTANLSAKLIGTGDYVYENNRFTITNGEYFGGYYYNLIYNPLSYKISVYTGLKIVNASTGETERYLTGSLSLVDAFDDISDSVWTMPADLSDGKYYLYPVYRTEDTDWELIRMPYGKQQYVTLTVTGGKQTFTNDNVNSNLAYDLIVTDIQCHENQFELSPGAFKITIANVGDKDYSGDIDVVITDPDDEYWATTINKRASIGAGRTGTITVTGNIVFSSEDNVVLRINDKDGNQLCEDFPISIITPPSYGSKTSNLTVSDISPNFAVNGNASNLTMKVSNSSRDEVKTSLEVDVLDETGTESQKSLTSEEISFYSLFNSTVSFGSLTLDLPAGEYNWQIKDGDGTEISDLIPLKVISGPYVDNNVVYYVSSEKNKTAYVCQSLTNYSGKVEIPSAINGYTINHIQGGSFTFENTLTDIVIPATINELSDGEFYGATGLKTLTVNNPIPPIAHIRTFNNDAYDNVRLQVPEGSEEAYRNADVWKNFSNIVSTAGVDDISIVEETTGNVYNMFGIIVARNATSDTIAKLPKGIYVVNGKKVLVK
jgi:hypothetical protein